MTEAENSYLGAFVLSKLADGVDNPDLDRMIRRVKQDSWRTIISSALALPATERAEHISERIEGADIDGQMGQTFQMVQMNLPVWEDKVRAMFPCPAGMDLERAAQKFTSTEWLWHLWVPRGYLSLMLGQSGIGKSSLALRIGHSVVQPSTPWPDGQAANVSMNGNTPRVCYIDTESRQHLLAERADTWGIPRSRIIWPLDPEQKGNETPSLLLDDERQWKLLYDYLNEWRPALTVIDSLSGGHRMDENSSDIRDIMIRLSDTCRDLHLSILLLHHLRKAGPDERGGAIDLDRSRGSSTITQLAAQVMALDMPDPTQRGNLRLRIVKTNVGGEPPALGVRITDTGMTFGPAPGEPATWNSLSEARAFLLEYLKELPRAANDVRAEAAQRGVVWGAVERAKRELGVQVRRESTGQSGTGRWMWYLQFKQSADQPHWSDR